MEKIVDNWIRQAEYDLGSAKYNLKGKKYDVAAYLCQQTVEKGLKGLYLKQEKELWKTHDLVKLAALVKAPAEIVKICNDLNRIYVEDRYPDYSDVIPAKKFVKEDVEEFIKKAQEVLRWIKTQLK